MSTYPRGVHLPYLRAWRHYRLLTQEELARRARLTSVTVSHAENGHGVSIVTAGRLARALRAPSRESLLQPPPEVSHGQAR